MIDCMVNPADLFLGIEPVAAPSAAGGGGRAPSFDLDAALAEWRVFFDARDGDTRNMSGSALVGIESKGTLDHLAKVTAGGFTVVTVNGVELVRAGSTSTVALRNAADSANINRHDVVANNASTYLAVVRRPSGGELNILGRDTAFWAVISLAVADELTAQYWDTTYRTATRPETGGAYTLLTVRHHNGELVAGVDGVEGTPVACSSVGGDSAYNLLASVVANFDLAFAAMHNTGNPDGWNDIVTAAMTIVNALNA